MEPVAPGVWLLEGIPPYAINEYLVEDVLIDTGTRWAGRRLLRTLRRRPVSLVALTHCHPDHRGSAALVCRTLGVPLACHEADAPVMEGRQPMYPRLPPLVAPLVDLGPYPVGRVLRDGDEVAGFRVVHAPGHTSGHVFYFRESDRVVIAGDVLANVNLITGRPGLREPPRVFSLDPARNRDSARQLLSLRPSVVCFGHGPPLRDPEALERFVARLPGAAANP
ncbi:MAG TPA: MBL fold metallo-hydrolase [Gemmataceae bacterium]|nr:MBL fold metallo-hydrolase [Gemmataceae bacterium]